MRTFGAISWVGNQWALDQIEPHVSIRLKKIFPKIPKTAVCPYTLAGTTEVAREMEWFTDRYPLRISDEDRLRLVRMAREFDQTRAEIEEILLPDRKPAPLKIIGELRNYQAVGAELFLKAKRLLLGDATGNGKEQPVSAKVLTPAGWKRIGDIRVGDAVIGSAGSPIEVLGVFPQGEKDVYEVLFSDGSRARCGLDHLWAFDHNCGGKRAERITVTARQLLEGKMNGRISSQGRETALGLTRKSMLRLPTLSGPVVFSEQPKLPIPPYTFGAMLANASFRDSIALTVNRHDACEVRDRIIREGVQISREKNKPGCVVFGIPGLMKHLSALGVCGHYSFEKRIPRQYMTASPSDRVSLLQGLMDGDGCCSEERNRVTYSSTSRGLSEDLRELVECLGGIATVREYDRRAEGKSIEFLVRVRIPAWVKNPFSVARKAGRFSGTGRAVSPIRTFVSIQYVGREESVCIRVSAPDRLYCTEHAILTHNTVTALAALSDIRTRPAIVVVQTHLTYQWAAMAWRFLGASTHIIKGTQPYNLPPADIYITTYSRLSGWINVFEGGKFPCVVFDECQELRRTESQKYQAAAVLSKAAQFVLGLSATPVYNFGDEIFNVLDAINPGCLGDFESFSREWCGWGRSVQDPKALGAYLREQHLMLRRTRADIERELPPINKIVHTVGYDEEAVEDTLALAKALAVRVTTGSFVERGEAARELDIMMRMVTGVSKAKYVAEYVKILLENNEPVLLALWHRQCYSIIGKELENYNPVMYTGSESPAQKEAAKEAFISGKTNLMMISLRSGIGLDGLQHRCKYVVFGELDYSPAVHQQVEGRVDRDGQQNQVTSIYLVSDGGSDPLMVDLLGLKASEAAAIIDPFVSAQAQYSDSSRLKALAEYVLKKHGST